MKKTETIIFEDENVKFYDSEFEVFQNKISQGRINYNKIQKFSLYKGFLLKNNLIIIFTCLAIIYFNLDLLKYSLDAYKSENMGIYGFLMYFFNRGSIISTWGPIMLCVASICGIYTSFIRSFIIKIETIKKHYKIRIWKITKENKTSDLESFLNEKLD